MMLMIKFMVGGITRMSVTRFSNSKGDDLSQAFPKPGDLRDVCALLNEASCATGLFCYVVPFNVISPSQVICGMYNSMRALLNEAFKRTFSVYCIQ